MIYLLLTKHYLNLTKFFWDVKYTENKLAFIANNYRRQNMGRVQIENTTDFYDDVLDVVIDKYGNICSSTPDNTFAFGDKLYTYGTVVTMSLNGRVLDAVFQKGTDANEFKSVDGTKSMTMYGSFGGWYNWTDNTYVIEIKKAVDYYPQLPSKEDPPTAQGYKTVWYKDPNNPTKNTYYDHLYGCVVDYAGNVSHNVTGDHFGFKNHIYMPGTRVIVKAYAGDKRYNTKSTPPKCENEKRYIYYTARWDGTYYQFDGTILPRDNSIKRSCVTGHPEKLGTFSSLEIVYISEPHYFRPEGREVNSLERFKLNGGNAPIDTSVGTIWYIIIMIVGTIFHARILIWIVATAIYFLWKYGYFNK